LYLRRFYSNINPEMQARRHSQTSRIVSFLDIGTNAARLTTAQFNGTDAYRVLADTRVPTRLGENAPAGNRLAPRAIRRAIRACCRLVRLSRQSGAKEIIAVATSAAREASNRNLFLKKLEREAFIRPVILPERQEARLIYKASASPANLRDRRVFVLEIGGGTTELAWGHGHECEGVKILKLGAVRMKTRHPVIAARAGVPLAVYERIVAEVKSRIKKQLRSLTGRPFDIVLGGAGTILNLADMAGRLYRGRKLAAGDVVSSKQLKEIIRCLCAQTLAGRRKAPGINPDRADIIIGGAAILEAITDLLKIKSIRASFSGLREGLILDYLARQANFKNSHKDRNGKKREPANHAN
jgi:exopolyphosphatase / guanosine-5'-triphosphate,3'-diphosphate pyrophosphatase